MKSHWRYSNTHHSYIHTHAHTYITVELELFLDALSVRYKGWVNDVM